MRTKQRPLQGIDSLEGLVCGVLIINYSTADSLRSCILTTSMYRLQARNENISGFYLFKSSIIGDSEKKVFFLLETERSLEYHFEKNETATVFFLKDTATC